MEETLTIEKRVNRTQKAQAKKLLMNSLWAVVFTANILILLSLLFDQGGMLWYLLIW